MVTTTRRVVELEHTYREREMQMREDGELGIIRGKPDRCDVGGVDSPAPEGRQRLLKMDAARARHICMGTQRVEGRRRGVGEVSFRMES